MLPNGVVKCFEIKEGKRFRLAEIHPHGTLALTSTGTPLGRSGR